ncbi:hypothetical protein FIBSPDRAFT_849974, partial [Athelia psychrophila]
ERKVLATTNYFKGWWRPDKEDMLKAYSSDVQSQKMTITTIHQVHRPPAPASIPRSHPTSALDSRVTNFRNDAIASS